MSLLDNGIPSGAFTGRRAVTSQSYTEANSKAGNQHEASRLFMAVAGLAAVDTIFTTGDLPVSVKGRLIGYSGVGLQADIFEAPTFTGGTVLPYQNASAINPVTGLVTLLTGATVTDVGETVFATSFVLGNASNQGRGNTGLIVGTERLLKPNTSYLFRITSLDTGVQNICSFVSWYEGELDLPLRV